MVGQDVAVRRDDDARAEARLPRAVGGEACPGRTDRRRSPGRADPARTELLLRLRARRSIEPSRPPARPSNDGCVGILSRRRSSDRQHRQGRRRCARRARSRWPMPSMQPASVSADAAAIASTPRRHRWRGTVDPANACSLFLSPP